MGDISFTDIHIFVYIVGLITVHLSLIFIDNNHCLLVLNPFDFFRQLHFHVE